MAFVVAIAYAVVTYIKAVAAGFREILFVVARALSGIKNEKLFGAMERGINSHPACVLKATLNLAAINPRMECVRYRCKIILQFPQHFLCVRRWWWNRTESLVLWTETKELQQESYTRLSSCCLCRAHKQQ